MVSLFVDLLLLLFFVFFIRGGSKCSLGLVDCFYLSCHSLSKMNMYICVSMYVYMYRLCVCYNLLNNAILIETISRQITLCPRAALTLHANSNFSSI